jgi:hypothetical protein
VPRKPHRRRQGPNPLHVCKSSDTAGEFTRHVQAYHLHEPVIRPVVALGKPVNAPCRANRTAAAEPSRDRGKPVSEPCRAKHRRAAAAEPSRDRGKPVSEPCRANRTAAAEPSRDRGKHHTVLPYHRCCCISGDGSIFRHRRQSRRGGGMWPDGTNPALVLYESIPTITAAAANRAVPRSGAPCDVPSRARPHPV